MSPRMTEINQQERYQIISRVNWLCTAVDTLLTILKLGIGLAVRSPALIADGLHSLSDLATDILALILGRMARHGPDQDHPYGHARYETVGTAVLGTVLMMVALGISVENVQAMLAGNSITPHWIAMVAVVVSIVSKEALFHITMKYARQTNSNLLEANAWHSRSDSLSSIVVMVGLLAGYAGWPWVEYIAALGVAALIGKMGAELAWDAIQDLIDRGVSDDQKAGYIESLKQLRDIKDVHLLRSRLMGNDVFLDAHIQVAPQISVSEAHQINDFATATLKQSHLEIKDVTLHIDFEPDHRHQTTTLSPKRQDIENLLNEADIQLPVRFDLHYQHNQVVVDLIYKNADEAEQAAEHCDQLTAACDWIRTVRVLLDITA